MCELGDWELVELLCVCDLGDWKLVELLCVCVSCVTECELHCCVCELGDWKLPSLQGRLGTH